jgi:hypothetical protein
MLQQRRLADSQAHRDLEARKTNGVQQHPNF